MTYPALAAVVYGVSALYTFETIEDMKKKKPWSPWAILDDARFDPYRVLNGDYDPFRNLKD
jgi:hypothetical protein